jgi:hypothetical protein
MSQTQPVTIDILLIVSLHACALFVVSMVSEAQVAKKGGRNQSAPLLGIYQRVYVRRPNLPGSPTTLEGVRLFSPGQILPKANWRTIAVSSLHFRCYFYVTFMIMIQSDMFHYTVDSIYFSWYFTVRLACDCEL